MKKCAECSREIDKLSVVCEYCGILPGDEQNHDGGNCSKEKASTEKKISELERNIKNGTKA